MGLKEIFYLTLASFSIAQAQTKMGYTAVQVGLDNNLESKNRTYLNFTNEYLGLELKAHLLNEFNLKNPWGREVIEINAGLPIGLIYATRVGGDDFNSIRQNDQSVGARIDLGLLKEVYGWSDITYHINNPGTEIIVALGKNFGQHALESTMLLRNDRKYLELEYLSPSIINIGDLKVKLFQRSEFYDKSSPIFNFGVHGML